MRYGIAHTGKRVVYISVLAVITKKNKTYETAFILGNIIFDFL